MSALDLTILAFLILILSITELKNVSFFKNFKDNKIINKEEKDESED